MSGIPQSFQRRTDDLYLLKTRNLVFENVDGTFPVKGAISYTTNTAGSIGFSTVTADNAGNLTIPGTTTMGLNAYVTVDGGTGILTAKQDVNVGGKMTVTNAVQAYAFNLVNTSTRTIVSKLDDRTISGVETLTWENTVGESEPISGWNAKLTPSIGIFRTVDISGLTGATLIMAQNQNALLTLFQQRGVFLTTLLADSTLAAVFNTSVSLRFVVSTTTLPTTTYRFDYGVTGNPAAAVPYTNIVNGINLAARVFVTSDTFAASYTVQDTPSGPVGTFTFTTGPNYTMQITDITTNGTAQLFLNHIDTVLLTNTPYPGVVNATVRDFTVVMPSTPTAAPTVVGVPDISNCTILINPVPLTTPVAIQNVAIYWCLSGSAFSSSPNAIIPALQTTMTYRITGLAPGGTYNVALSYRSLYDESPRGPVLTFTTQIRSSALAGPSNINVYSVEVTEDVNWLSTPSYGTSTINYGKQYMSNVKFTVASVFSSIWTDTLGDLKNISQIQSVSIDVYAGAATASGGARFFVGNNPLTNILYASSDAIDAKYEDAVGIGGSINIYPDADGIVKLHKIFNANNDGVIDVGKNMVFGWYSTPGGIRNCEMTRFNVIYTV